MTKRDRAEKEVLKQENDVPKQDICSFFSEFLKIHFVPGRPGTEGFVPGHLLLPLSRNKGTPGHEIFFVPGQRDDETSHGTSRPVETLLRIM